MSIKTFELVYTALNSQESNVGVVIVAAGSASRMAGTNKILAPIMGKSVISHTLLAFNNHPLVGDIVLVTRKDMILDLQKEVEKGGFNKVTDIIEGGNCREQGFFGENGFIVVQRHGVGHQTDRNRFHAGQGADCFFHGSLAGRTGQAGHDVLVFVLI